MTRRQRPRPTHDVIQERSREPEAPRRGDASDRPPAPAPAASNRRLQRLLAEGLLRPKLEVGAPGDAHEREAERVAEALTRTPAPAPAPNPAAPGDGPDRPEEAPLRRMCPRCRRRHRRGRPLDCPECEAELQRRTDGSKEGSATALEGATERRVRGLGPGRPLPAPARSFFEPRLGRDLSDVRVHTGPEADRAARSVDARAFTLGREVAFRAGEYRPGTDAGRRLLAHELTHVAQQGEENGNRGSVRRQQDAEKEETQQRDGESALKSKACNVPAECPEEFCTPFLSKDVAKGRRAWKEPILLSGIAAAVGPRVVPVWYNYLHGGDSKRDFSSRFRKDFEESKTTQEWTRRMKKEIIEKVKRFPPRPGRESQVRPIGRVIPGLISDLNTPLVGMNFDIPGEIPGNLAGDIGKDQKECKVGAKPSDIIDDRSAQGTIEIARTESGNLKVTPSIEFFVQDTVDLCPGGCGTWLEQWATVLLSRFEATGISGDVPFEVKFPAPMDPFVVSMDGSGASEGNGSADVAAGSASDSGSTGER